MISSTNPLIRIWLSGTQSKTRETNVQIQFHDFITFPDHFTVKYPDFSRFSMTMVTLYL